MLFDVLTLSCQHTRQTLLPFWGRCALPTALREQAWSSRLIGQARILYARRQHPQALKLFQDVLRYNPECKPDPRIGIGLCFWALDQKPRAKAAWQRCLEVV